MNRITISPLMLLQMLIQVALSLRFLKNVHVAHLDIKPNNLLVGKGSLIKTSDLGEAHVYLEKDAERRT
jgi:serine/threonine protein kinase